MRVTLDCGCNVDDAYSSTVHEADGYHYALGTSPETFCKRCDLFKPCLCVAAAAACEKPRAPKSMAARDAPTTLLSGYGQYEDGAAPQICAHCGLMHFGVHQNCGVVSYALHDGKSRAMRAWDIYTTLQMLAASSQMVGDKKEKSNKSLANRAFEIVDVFLKVRALRAHAAGTPSVEFPPFDMGAENQASARVDTDKDTP